MLECYVIFSLSEVFGRLIYTYNEHELLLVDCPLISSGLN